MLSLNCDPLALAVLGLGGVLVGLAELGLGCVRRFPTWGVTLALAAALAAGGGAAYACDLAAMVAQPAWVLSGALVGLLLVRSKHSIAGRQLVQGGILTVLGGALLGFATYRLDQGLENDLSESDFAMASLTDPIDVGGPPARLAHTDAGTQIPLFEPSPYASAASEDHEAKFLHNKRLGARLILTAPADLKYNCHGWVFTGGRYWVRGDAVATILKDNGYRQVERPRGGDVAVFRNQLGEITHTGLVRAGNRNGSILIESKWGRFGRYVHGPEEHGYRGHAVTYYHTTRGTNVLKGVEDAASGSSVAGR